MSRRLQEMGLFSLEKVRLSSISVYKHLVGCQGGVKMMEADSS